MGALELSSAAISSIFRVLSFVYLRVAPIRALKIALPALYLAYLTSLLFVSTPPEPPKKKQAKEKTENGDSAHESPPKPKTNSFYASLALSIPSSSSSKFSILIVNTLIALASLEFTLFPYFDSATDVIFSRVGAVYPDAAKITVRYPVANATQSTIQLLWRKASTTTDTMDSGAWTDGPVLEFSPSHDWVNTTKLLKLWPDTEYEYVLADANKTILDYPSTPLRFRTFPDPRLPGGSRFRFFVSSCATPNFPYRPFSGRRIKGFDLLADYLALDDKPVTPLPASTPEVAPPAPPPEPETTTEATETVEPVDVETPSADDSVPPPVQTAAEPEVVAEALVDATKPRVEFGLFLGDFIYADVPMYFGEDAESYRRLYRRNYQSSSFRRVYEKIPIFHTYDDHEIYNNYAGQANDSNPPFPGASDAFQIYNAEPNFEPIEKDQYYYEFRYGDAAFFVMDTRRYRSNTLTEPLATRTMLGDQQLTALYDWLGRVNSTATFKFIVSSVPFTDLWTYEALVDCWRAFPSEKAALLDAFHSVPNVIILSGDRHEFAAIEYNSPREDGHTVLEFSTSPLSMFDVPFIRTLMNQTEATVQRKSIQIQESEDGTDVVEVITEIPQERALKYLPLGNYKWSAIELDTTNPAKPTLNLEVMINGKTAYLFEVIGKPVKLKSTTALGAFVPDGIKSFLLDTVGFSPSRWF